MQNILASFALNLQGREQKSAVFKGLLEMKLKKSVILLLLSVFVVHHYCLGRMIVQIGLL